MAIENNPRPDNIPERPRLTADVLRNLYASDVIANNPTAPSDTAQGWLIATRRWAAWAIEYCRRLDAVYVEHQAVAHDRRVEPGELDHVSSICGGEASQIERCKVCAYLYEQHEANQL